ncbi:hypothetical protein EJ04DRAFT_27839 [Polyplosphaeria fusca]|uniref:Uncharacterized protein n=1 Tax=Polyplosphaeria fusca TaxID=682080 RepID=A0A9P4R9G1_9PLEO|nr:hypothetical protein EJ04DRAFT_27839 [Polyplosphaeria fusca]
MAPNEWTFVATTGKRKERNDNSRRVVRQSAMRNFRQRQRIARVHEYQQSQTQESRTGNVDAGDVQDESNEANNRIRELLAQRQMGNALLGEPGNGLDPFDSTVLQKHHRGAELFLHFLQCSTPLIQPKGPYMRLNAVGTHIAKLALSDPAFLSTALFHAGTHLDGQHGGTWSPATLYHRGETIRQLKAKLENQNESTTDSAIAMVAFLAGTGDVISEETTQRSHNMALRAMIQIRGGRLNLGWKCMVHVRTTC